MFVVGHVSWGKVHWFLISDQRIQFHQQCPCRITSAQRFPFPLHFYCSSFFPGVSFFIICSLFKIIKEWNIWFMAIILHIRGGKYTVCLVALVFQFAELISSPNFLTHSFFKLFQENLMWHSEQKTNLIYLFFFFLISLSLIPVIFLLGLLHMWMGFVVAFQFMGGYWGREQCVFPFLVRTDFRIIPKCLQLGSKPLISSGERLLVFVAKYFCRTHDHFQQTASELALWYFYYWLICMRWLKKAR